MRGSNTCSPQTFAQAIFAYSGVGAPDTGPNEYAMEIWERAEGGGAGCPGQPAYTSPWSYSGGPAGNPLNTTRSEPGATNWNSVGVKIFQNYDGETCWYWGVKANGDTLLNGYYGAILNVLRSPAGDNHSQCVDLPSPSAARRGARATSRPIAARRPRRLVMPYYSPRARAGAGGSRRGIAQWIALARAGRGHPCRDAREVGIAHVTTRPIVPARPSDGPHGWNSSRLGHQG